MFIYRPSTQTSTTGTTTRHSIWVLALAAILLVPLMAACGEDSQAQAPASTTSQYVDENEVNETENEKAEIENEKAEHEADCDRAHQAGHEATGKGQKNENERAQHENRKAEHEGVNASGDHEADEDESDEDENDEEE
jgi:hypothetical protein